MSASYPDEVVPFGERYTVALANFFALLKSDKETVGQRTIMDVYVNACNRSPSVGELLECATKIAIAAFM